MNKEEKKNMENKYLLFTTERLVNKGFERVSLMNIRQLAEWVVFYNRTKVVKYKIKWLDLKGSKMYKVQLHFHDYNPETKEYELSTLKYNSQEVLDTIRLKSEI